MKRILSIVFAALLLLCGCTDGNRPSSVPAGDLPDADTPAEEPLAPVDLGNIEIDGYGEFCDILAAKLLDGSKNSNLSPISVYLALAMAAEGAKGETQTAMLRLLGSESIEELRGVCGGMLERLSVDTEDSSLSLADSIWMAGRDGALSFDGGFLKALTETYRSEANTVEFGKEETGRQIAGWITEKTHGKIKVSPDAMRFSYDTVAVLINTIYLKDAWREEFYEGATEADTFYGPGGELTADFMHRRDTDSTIVQGSGFLRYSIPLMRVGRMTFVLPDEGVSLSDILDTPEALHTALNDGKEIRAHVNVKIPKFRFQDRFDLNDPLKELGIGIAFSDGADFSGISSAFARISSVLQESYIGIDEKGVEAAAYTMIALAEGMAMPEQLEEIDFFLTRPFLYAIESYDGTVLFIGTVTAPGTEP